MNDEKLNLTEVDFTVRDEGTIVLLYPQNDAARSWIDEHLYGDDGDAPTWFGGAVAIDHRMAQAILEGVENDRAGHQV
jgi:hypothetical protein